MENEKKIKNFRSFKEKENNSFFKCRTTKIVWAKSLFLNDEKLSFEIVDNVKNGSPIYNITFGNKIIFERICLTDYKKMFCYDFENDNFLWRLFENWKITWSGNSDFFTLSNDKLIQKKFIIKKDIIKYFSYIEE